jgi:hypothetical protein
MPVRIEGKLNGISVLDCSLEGSSHVLLKKAGCGDLSILVLIGSDYRYERSLCCDQCDILTGA